MQHTLYMYLIHTVHVKWMFYYRRCGLSELELHASHNWLATTQKMHYSHFVIFHFVLTFAHNQWNIGCIQKFYKQNKSLFKFRAACKLIAMGEVHLKIHYNLQPCTYIAVSLFCEKYKYMHWLFHAYQGCILDTRGIINTLLSVSCIHPR